MESDYQQNSEEMGVYSVCSHQKVHLHLNRLTLLPGTGGFWPAAPTASTRCLIATCFPLIIKQQTAFDPALLKEQMLLSSPPNLADLPL